MEVKEQKYVAEIAMKGNYWQINDRNLQVNESSSLFGNLMSRFRHVKKICVNYQKLKPKGFGKESLPFGGHFP